jgi:CheY-like chemotaxis protein
MREEAMARQRVGDGERRHDARIRARGSVIVHAARHACGRIVDVSSGGIRIRLAVGARPEKKIGARVRLDLHLDGARFRWVHLAGRVRQIHKDTIGISLTHVPADFEDRVQDHLLADLENRAHQHVLLVDPDPIRRMRLATEMRAAGREVLEVASPLEAIARLAETHRRPTVVAIADTVPTAIADELRAYLSAEVGDVTLERVRR